MKRYLTATLFLLFFTTSLFLSASDNNIYISNDGSDLNPGTLKSPKQTVSAALDIANPGSTIFLFPGTYSGSITLKNVSGEPNNPITIESYSNIPADYAVIDGGASNPGMDLNNLWIEMKGCSWLTIKNLKFINGWTDPIVVRDSSYITFDNCIITGGRRVIYAKGADVHHIIIENCHWDQGGKYLWEVKKAPNGGDAWTEMHHGCLQYYNGSLFYPKGTGGSHVVRNNTVINAFNAFRWKSVDVETNEPNIAYNSNMELYGNKISNMRDNDFEPEAAAFNLHFYHNICHNIHKSMSLDNIIGGYIYCYGNVWTMDSDPWSDEVCAGWWKIYNQLTYPFYAFNNSFYGNEIPFMYMEGPAMHMKSYNNAYYITGTAEWELGVWDRTMDFDYDCSNKPWPKNITDNDQEKNGVIADINFVDATNRNLKLKSDSPGIDAGKIVKLNGIYDWKQMFEGTAPDIGAYDNNKLVEGPPFKFTIPPNSMLSYKEMPRIVRHKIDGNMLKLYFSEDIDQNSISENTVYLISDSKVIAPLNITFDSPSELTVHAASILNKDNTELIFKSMPLGVNGEKATIWASTIKAIKI
jgi:hypothetical protein